jgi:Allene oxide cyclase barrel like domain
VPKRRIAAALAVAALAVAGSAQAHDGRTIKLVEAHPDLQPTFVDTGKPGPSVGDVVVARDGVSRESGASAGTFTQVCTLVELGSNPLTSTYECSGSIVLKGGTITMQGPFVPAQPEGTAAITGGTGDYRGARGEIVVRAEADQLIVRL